MDSEECETCWICLEGNSEGGPCANARAPLELLHANRLIQPCRCPRVVHSVCLAKWQLSQSGRSEEKFCRFCKDRLPDWQENLALPGMAAVEPVMSVHFNGQTHMVKVKPGEDGRVAFIGDVRRLLRLRDNQEFSITFECKVPGHGMFLDLKGLSSYDAAVFCAAMTAVERQRLAAQKAAQKAAAAASSAAAAAAATAPAPAAPAATAPVAAAASTAAASSVRSGQSGSDADVAHPASRATSSTSAGSSSDAGTRGSQAGSGTSSPTSDTASSRARSGTSTSGPSVPSRPAAASAATGPAAAATAAGRAAAGQPPAAGSARTARITNAAVRASGRTSHDTYDSFCEVEPSHVDEAHGGAATETGGAHGGVAAALGRRKSHRSARHAPGAPGAAGAPGATATPGEEAHGNTHGASAPWFTRLLMCVTFDTGAESPRR
ncbi:hypothetical protein HYH03_011190 [Edaphochlamys debaryana]|uniref:RING-CH-type domain-containing protein n=1 Tax=Edaphochlamys debaryana TaxID=47281 RepID=A0A836BVF4_9CHLO|nr:hypothetical protein HYH03_011190 [Edaphochlamys debaryana]|eukprot:KAG2490390.1 hypothetical protein HYH03_011190 [Edaphochlamys debaryana]